jgi:membrane associated rhomboid family serine protease
VLGGYLVLFPTVRVRGLILLGYFVRMVELSAVWVLGMWFVLQVFNGLGSVGMLIGGGVAFFAHIGGFIAGVVLTWLFTRLFPQPPAPERVYMVYRHTQNNPWW